MLLKQTSTTPQLSAIRLVCRGMRRIAICAAIILALFGLASANGARTRHAERHYCPKVGKFALVVDAQAEVYEAEGRYRREMFACAYASGHAYALGPETECSGTGGCGGVEKVTLGGPFVAYEKFSAASKPFAGETSSYSRVIVRNLRTGRIVHRANSTGSFVENMVVESDGAVAWIVETSSQPEERAVIALDKTGTRTLASGPGIAPSSLTLRGSTLSWTQDGRIASAVLN